jgi:hypothetical protein
VEGDDASTRRHPDQFSIGTDLCPDLHVSR